MKRCTRCSGFVPESSGACPNCSATSRWWAVPLAVLGAGGAALTLSACYGAPCATKVLPDGGTGYACGLDCEALLPDGGTYAKDPTYASTCASVTTDGGADAGRADGGP